MGEATGGITKRGAVCAAIAIQVLAPDPRWQPCQVAAMVLTGV